KIAAESTCEESLPALGIRYFAPEGIRPGELCYEIDTEDGTALIVTDLLFNLKHTAGVDGFMFKLFGSSGFFGMTNIGKLFMLSNKQAFREWLLKMSKSDVTYICMAHGDIITNGAS